MVKAKFNMKYFVPDISYKNTFLLHSNKDDFVKGQSGGKGYSWERYWCVQSVVVVNPYQCSIVSYQCAKMPQSIEWCNNKNKLHVTTLILNI